MSLVRCLPLRPVSCLLTDIVSQDAHLRVESFSVHSLRHLGLDVDRRDFKSSYVLEVLVDSDVAGAAFLEVVHSDVVACRVDHGVYMGYLGLRTYFGR
jgi:hypothetical protein